MVLQGIFILDLLIEAANLIKKKLISITASPTGWTDDKIFVHWFTEVFIPQAEALCVNRMPIVLSLDSYNSHETPEVKAAAYNASLIIIAFPSKTTHKLQPLDVGVFGALQRKWYTHADNCLARGVKINRYNVIQEYCSIHDVITPFLVQKAFKHTGIYPLNPNLFTEKDFAPAWASSIMACAHLPLSYPREVPTSPIMAPSNINSSSSSNEDDSDFELESKSNTDLLLDSDIEAGDDGDNQEDASDHRVQHTPASAPSPLSARLTSIVTCSSVPDLSWATTLPPMSQLQGAVARSECVCRLGP